MSLLNSSGLFFLRILGIFNLPELVHQSASTRPSKNVTLPVQGDSSEYSTTSPASVAKSSGSDIKLEKHSIAGRTPLFLWLLPSLWAYVGLREPPKNHILYAEKLAASHKALCSSYLENALLGPRDTAPCPGYYETSVPDVPPSFAEKALPSHSRNLSVQESEVHLSLVKRQNYRETTENVKATSPNGDIRWPPQVFFTASPPKSTQCTNSVVDNLSLSITAPAVSRDIESLSFNPARKRKRTGNRVFYKYACLIALIIVAFASGFVCGYLLDMKGNLRELKTATTAQNNTTYTAPVETEAPSATAPSIPSGINVGHLPGEAPTPSRWSEPLAPIKTYHIVWARPTLNTPPALRNAPWILQTAEPVATEPPRPQESPDVLPGEYVEINAPDSNGPRKELEAKKPGTIIIPTPPPAANEAISDKYDDRLLMPLPRPADEDKAANSKKPCCKSLSRYSSEMDATTISTSRSILKLLRCIITYFHLSGGLLVFCILKPAIFICIIRRRQRKRKLASADSMVEQFGGNGCSSKV